MFSFGGSTSTKRVFISYERLIYADNSCPFPSLIDVQITSVTNITKKLFLVKLISWNMSHLFLWSFEFYQSFVFMLIDKLIRSHLYDMYSNLLTLCEAQKYYNLHFGDNDADVVSNNDDDDGGRIGGGGRIKIKKKYPVVSPGVWTNAI
uniref:Uncharacterized protein n=1 Tax=Glossina pallidipes TaxID=7398 RepID=A0A1A9ZAP4_GLOPL